MREDIWEIGAARTGEDLAASEVEKLCQGVETDAHGVKKKKRVSELIGKVGKRYNKVKSVNSFIHIDVYIKNFTDSVFDQQDLGPAVADEQRVSNVE
jgi:hypothetical protein